MHGGEGGERRAGRPQGPLGSACMVRQFFSPVTGICPGSSLHPQTDNYKGAAAGFRETDEPVLLINQPSLELSGKAPRTPGDLEVAVQFLVHLPAGGLTLAPWQTDSKPQFLTQEWGVDHLPCLPPLCRGMFI